MINAANVISLLEEEEEYPKVLKGKFGGSLPGGLTSRSTDYYSEIPREVPSSVVKKILELFETRLYQEAYEHEVKNAEDPSKVDRNAIDLKSYKTGPLADVAGFIVLVDDIVQVDGPAMNEIIGGMVMWGVGPLKYLSQEDHRYIVAGVASF